MFYWTSDHSSGHHGGNAVMAFLCILKDHVLCLGKRRGGIFEPAMDAASWFYLPTSSLCEELRLLYNTNSLCTCFLSSAMVMLLRNLQSLVWEVSRQDQINWIRRLETACPWENVWSCRGEDRCSFHAFVRPKAVPGILGHVCDSLQSDTYSSRNHREETHWPGSYVHVPGGCLRGIRGFAFNGGGITGELWERRLEWIISLFLHLIHTS